MNDETNKPKLAVLILIAVVAAIIALDLDVVGFVRDALKAEP
jgi:hypothetical protein